MPLALAKSVSVTITPQWRDEDYGNVSAYAAFRLYDSQADWSARTERAFLSACKRAGYTFHHGRCSWIAEPKRGEANSSKDASNRAAFRQRLVDELRSAGFSVPPCGACI